MSMLYAYDQDEKLTYIDEANRGLACNCVCLTCGEVVMAKKGQRNKHHFAHYCGKSACTIAPESVLHKLAKQAILEAEGLHLPPMPGVFPHPDVPEADRTSWWDFVEVYEEQTQQDFRPDLVAQLKDGTRLFIEIAVTSFVGEQKQDKIDRLQEKTIELDLRYLIGLMGHPRSEICKHIVHDTDQKTWLYPCIPEGVDLYLGKDVVQPEAQLISENLQPNKLLSRRFTVYGMWLESRVLPSGDLVVQSWSYNPQIIELLRGWSREMGGRYVRSHKNWLYPKDRSEEITLRLEQLHYVAEKTVH
jgi:hypothetical protein